MSAAAPPPAQARRTVGVGAVVTTAGSLVTAAAGGILGIVVARILGPAHMGSYTLAATTLFLLLTITALGIQTGATYYTAGRGWPVAEAFPQLQVAAISVGLVGALGGLVIAALTRHSIFRQLPLTDLLPALAALPFALSWTYVTGLALAQDAYEVAAALPLVAVAGTLVLAAVLAPRLGLIGAVSALGSGHVLAAAGGLLWWRRRLDRPAAGWLRAAQRRIRRATVFGAQVQLPQVLQLLCYRGDLFVLNAVAAAATVGHYAVALTISEVGMLLPRALASVVLPRVADLDAADDSAQRRMVETKSVRHVLVLLPGVCIALALGMLLVPWVFGGAYRDAVGPGLVLVPGVGAVGLTGVLASIIIGRGVPRYQLVVALTVTPATLLLYALLIPAWDAYGAAIASTVSYLSALIVTSWAFHQATGHGLRDVLPRREDLADYGALLRRRQRRAISST